MTPPLIKTLEDLIPPKKNRATALRAGIGQDTLYKWFQGTDPRLSLFEAVLNAVGYTLKIVPIGEE